MRRVVTGSYEVMTNEGVVLKTFELYEEVDDWEEIEIPPIDDTRWQSIRDERSINVKKQVIIGVMLGMLAGGMITTDTLITPILAAPSKPIIVICPQVAQAGTIFIYHCEPENLPPFYQNSSGFGPVLLE